MPWFQSSYFFSAEVEKWGALGPISLMERMGSAGFFLSVVHIIMQFHWQMVFSSLRHGPVASFLRCFIAVSLLLGNSSFYRLAFHWILRGFHSDFLVLIGCFACERNSLFSSFALCKCRLGCFVSGLRDLCGLFPSTCSLLLAFENVAMFQITALALEAPASPLHFWGEHAMICQFRFGRRLTSYFQWI
jgi:hypothetical protein